MKEYKCSIIMSGYEGYTISSMMILNENDLEFLNRIAITLPFNKKIILVLNLELFYYLIQFLIIPILGFGIHLLKI